MTRNQETIAEKIIQIHKVNGGLLDWTALYYEESKTLLPSNLTDRQKVICLS